MRVRKELLAATIVVAIVVAASASVAFVGLHGRANVHAGSAAIGGPFTLVDDRGAQVSEAALKGKPTVMYFGYTFCPEVCPTTLTDLSHWMQMLGADADKLNYVFVTVDPERDTPKVMHEYVSAFDARIRGFTGTPNRSPRLRASAGFTTSGFRPWMAVT
jgi:protein SCO1